MNNQNIEIIQGIGFIYHNLKLIVTYPVGKLQTTRERLNVKQEVSFLQGGVQFAYPCEALNIAYQNLEAIQSNLGKPSEEIPVILSVLDTNTEELVEDIYNQFQNEYNIVKKYIDKGYEMKGLPYVFHNIDKYIPTNEKLESLTILNIETDKIKLDKLVEKSREGFYYEMDGENIPFILRKSKAVDHVYVVEEEQSQDTVAIYIPYAAYMQGDEYEGIYCIDENNLEEDLDFGNVDLEYNNSVGYLIQVVNNSINIKIANYVNYHVTGQTLVQVVEDTGVFEELMKKAIEEYIIK